MSEQIALNKDELAVSAGWITVYHVDPQTREYRKASDTNVVILNTATTFLRS